MWENSSYEAGDMKRIGIAPSGKAMLIVSCLALALAACQHGDIVIDAGDSVIASGGRASIIVAGRNVAKLRSEPRHILVLTSGGADGAFGAGVDRKSTRQNSSH